MIMEKVKETKASTFARKLQKKIFNGFLSAGRSCRNNRKRQRDDAAAAAVGHVGLRPLGRVVEHAVAVVVDPTSQRCVAAGGVGHRHADFGLRADSQPQVRERIDKLLEERFGPTHRNEMAVEIARHDQGRAPESFDAEHVRRKLRFHGSVPERVRAVLKEWLPGVLAFAAQSGLRLRDLNHEIHFYDRPSYEAATGPIPKGVKLPASSQHFNQLYRVYTVRVVLPDRISTVSQLLTVLRAVLARLLGDIFLREEIFTLQAYREDLENPEDPPGASLAPRGRS